MKIREIAKQSPLEEGAGAVISKLTPTYGVADAVYRAKEGDWLGAGIAGVATGLGLVPPVGPPGVAAQAGSIGLDAFNVLRDIAKEKGGWKNLGKEFIKAARDSRDFDQAGMGTMYESFAEIDRLDESGQLDEGLGVEILKKLGKYGGDVIDWAKNLRKPKPEVPTTPRSPDVTPPLTASEREALERAQEEAARRAEKELKVIDRRGQPKQDEIPIVGKDKTPPSAADEPLPQWNKKVHKSEEDYLNTLSRTQAERYKLNKEILATQGAPVKPGWVRRAGGWVADNPKKTIATLGTGYYLTPSAITDPVKDFVSGKAKGAANVTVDQIKQKVDDRLTDLEKERQEIQQQKEKEQGAPSSEQQPPAPPNETPVERERRLQGWPQSKADATTTVLERKYQQFLNDAEEKPTYTKDQYIGWAKTYSEKYNVPLSMVLHAMFKETGWLGDPEKMRTATSPTGARGVMQIQPQYAEKGAYKIKVKDLTDPEKNIEAGVRGLAYYFNKHKTPEKALAAYNAGEGGASTFLKTGDVNTLRTKETRNYIKGFKDDVIYQLEKFYPKNKDKVAQVATDVLATVVGAGNARAADEIPAAQGGPENPIKVKSYSKTDKLPPAPSAAELAKINKRLQNYKDPVKELEKIIQQADAAGQKTDTLKKELDNLKQDYEKDQAGKTALPPDDPNSTYINVGPVRLKVDGKLKSPKFPSIQSDIPSGDYQSQGDATAAKPAAKTVAVKPVENPKTKTRTTVDALGRETKYTQNEKGQWVDPRGNIMPVPEKPGSRKDLSISDTGVEPSAADLEKARKITGRSDPLIDPETGYPTTEKSLRAKIEKQQRDREAADQSAGEQERKRIADLEKAQSDSAKSRADAEKSASRSDSDKSKAANKKDKQQRAPDAVAPAADTKSKTNVRKEFERAFAVARAEKGPGQTFTFKDPRTGKESTFTTDYADEVKSKASKSDAANVDDAIAQIIKGKRVVPSAEPTDNRIASLVNDRLNQELKTDYTVDVDPEALKVPSVPAAKADTVIEPEKANVLRSTDGAPVKSGTGEPWGTGTSTQSDIDAAKKQLQKQIDDEKDKKELQKISPDLSEPEAQDTFQDKWSRGIEWLTGKKIPDPKELDKIRVPESVNTELKDILWLAGRTKK